MIRPKDAKDAQRLEQALLTYSKSVQPLVGIQDPSARRALIAQMLESIRRVNYVSVMRGRHISPRRANPDEEIFDPLKAAVLTQKAGNHDEACWLVFLFVHFGKHNKGGWRYVREVYGQLGAGKRWDWASVSADPSAFRAWLHKNRAAIQRKDAPGGFGNHRKRESLDATSAKGTGATVETYVKWIAPPRTHKELFEQAISDAKGEPRVAFDILYSSMSAVMRFGRTARFDYLTMIGKLGLAEIVPGSTYMEGATGPADGARLLFGGSNKADISRKSLNQRLVDLDSHLHVGMQVLEDALCNWQKSPGQFKRFRG